MWLTNIIIPYPSNLPDPLKNPVTKPKENPKSKNINMNEQKQDPNSKLPQETPVTLPYNPEPTSSKEIPKVQLTKDN